MPLTLTFVGVTDLGRVRRRNEDAYLLIPEEGVAVVADGMGGHPGGDVASRLAAETAATALRPATPSSQDSAAAPRDAMTGSVLAAHEAVRARGAADPSLAGMGTTLTAFLARPHADAWAIGHVGDSRGYLLRSGALRQLTRDDTWVQERVDAGLFTAEQARRHALGNVLTQCLGLDATPAVQVVEGTLQPDDLFLLCTDGLTGLVEDAVIARALEASGRDRAGLEATARGLAALANERGGRDNITAVLISVA